MNWDVFIICHLYSRKKTDMLIQIYSRLHVRCLISVLIDIFSMNKNSIRGLIMEVKWQWICYFLRRYFPSSITATTFTGLNYIYRTLAHVLFTLFVFVCVQWCPTYIVLCFCVVGLFFFVVCTLCCQFLWIVHFWLLLRYSLMVIYCFKIRVSSM